jgi:hypothetical protein
LILALIGVFVALVAILVATAPQHRANQPVYNGLTLAQWLDIVARHRINGYGPVIGSQTRQQAKDATPEQIHEAEGAIRVIGTNAFPFLLAWLNLKPNPLKIFYRGALDLLPIPDHARGFLWSIPGTEDERLAEFAVHGFRVLSTNAFPAFADLSKMANDTNHPLTQILAGKALLTVTNTTQ